MMRPALWTAMLLIAALPAAAGTPRLDLGLRDVVRLADETLRPQRELEIQRAQLQWHTGGDARVGLYVRTTDAARTQQRVLEAGGTVGARVGAILSLRLPPQQIAAIESWDEVRWAEAVTHKRKLLDLSLPEIRGPEAQAGTGLSMGYDGEGVILGIIDTGIQWDHPDFIDERGHTRVLALWDIDADFDHPPVGFDFGVECLPDGKNMIDRETGETCVSFDYMGHGTHCSGIMGSGRAPYLGVAPKGRYVMVRVLEFSNLTDSAQYVFGKADELGLPAVLNMSLGGHDGPHDGSSLEAQALDALTGPGRIILASAGNEGGDYLHVGYEVSETEQRTRVVIDKGGGNGLAVLNIWALQPTVLFAVELQDKQGTVIGESAWVGGADSTKQGAFQDGGLSYGKYWLGSSGGPAAINGKYQVRITLQPSADPDTYDTAEYSWLLKAKGSGSFNAWALTAAGYRLNTHFDGTTGDGIAPGDNVSSVGMPATGAQIIAVAAHNTKNSWTDKDGVEGSGAWDNGAIASFSSRGPSVDPSLNNIKPEISAPGHIIASAASDISASLPGFMTVVEGGDAPHVLMSGTSMSCPHVSGAVALLLQADPTLTPDDVEEIFRRSARADEFTGTDLPHPTWGFGKLDVQAALAVLEQDLCLEADAGGRYAAGVCESSEQVCLADNPGYRWVEGQCLPPKKSDGGCGAASRDGVLTAMLLLGLALALHRRSR